MDADKLQKINALANELKKHNIAQNNEDAVRQAEAAYSPNAKPAPKEEHTVVRQMDQDAVSLKKYELLLEMHNKKLEQELSMIKSALRQLSDEVNALKQAKPEPPKKPVQKELKTQPKEDHPKQGKFTSDDVSIEKMFYFGTKR